ncbi:MAG: hypothetical protein ACXW28_03160 [Thermoanaerobaculia bacterium]
MTTMTRSTVQFRDVRHHPITTALLIALTWIGAAVLVATAHTRVDRLSAAGGAVAVVASICAMAYVYMRLFARQADGSHALGVGVAWLALAIVTEMVVATQVGHGWYALLGSPEHPLLRSCFLFVWIFAPALFTRFDGDPS